jgi:hypothetical protein
MSAPAMNIRAGKKTNRKGTRNRAGAKGVGKHLKSDEIVTNIKFIFSTAFPFLLHLQIFVQGKSFDIRKTFRENKNRQT